MNTEAVAASLQKIAAEPRSRDAFVRSMIDFERHIDQPGVDVREEITGPLVDALFGDEQIVRKRLSSGIQLDFLYRTKIARDFVMSVPEQPDHAWEPQTTRLLLKLAERARTVVVGGAYFGDQAVLIAAAVAKNGGVVHAFEPNDDQRRMLMHNAELNGLTNIVPRSEGLWNNSSATLRLVGYDSFAHPEEASQGSEDGFQTLTIADYLPPEDNELDLIMLDIEGAELAALQGAAPFLERPAGRAPNIVFEVHRHYVDWSKGLENTEIVRFLTSRGYQAFAVRDFNSNYDLSHRPVELIPADSVYLEGPPHGFNMVAVKDMAVLDPAMVKFCRNVSPKLLRHKDPALHHPTEGL